MCSHVGGELAELKTYLITKLLWDQTLNETALIDEFLAGYYGAAAAPFVKECLLRGKVFAIQTDQSLQWAPVFGSTSDTSTH